VANDENTLGIRGPLVLKELVHFPNATMNGPCCGKVSALALKVQVTQDVKALTCVPCALAMLHAQAEANGALVQRLAVLVDKGADA
jgi:hypothetical protein